MTITIAITTTDRAAEAVTTHDDPRQNGVSRQVILPGSDAPVHLPAAAKLEIRELDEAATQAEVERFEADRAELDEA